MHTVSPAQALHDIAKIVRGTPKGQRRDRAGAEYQSRWGTLLDAQLYRSSTLAAAWRLPTGLLAYVGGEFTVPTTREALVTLTSADIDSGTWKLRITRRDGTFYAEAPLTKTGGAGAYFLTADLVAGEDIAVGVLKLTISAAIETTDFDGSTPTAPTESPDGTTITTTSGVIYDANLDAWRITAGGGITRNNGPTTIPDDTANVEELFILDHVIWQQAGGQFWRWVVLGTNPFDPANWDYQSTNDPRVSAPPPPGPIDPGTPGPRPTAASDGTPIATWLRTTPIAVSPNLVGLHAYRYPRGPSYNPTPSPRPSFGYKLRRSLNYNDKPTSCFIADLALGYGVRNWAPLDELLDTCYADGARLVLVAHQTPRYLVNPAWNDSYLQTNFPNPAPGFYGGTTEPIDLDEWALIIQQAVQRCQARRPGVLFAVEGINEPTMDGRDTHASGELSTCYWYGQEFGNGGGKESRRLDSLARTNKASYLGTKAGDPSILFIGSAFSPGSHSTTYPVAFYNRVIASGGRPRDFVDAYAGHGYTTGTSVAAMAAVLQEYVNDRDAVNPALPLYNTEAGNEGSNTIAQHALIIKRKGLLSAVKGFQSIFYYSYEDDGYLGNPAANPETSAALAWVVNNVQARSGTWLDYAGILSDGRLAAWFRGGAEVIA